MLYGSSRYYFKPFLSLTVPKILISFPGSKGIAGVPRGGRTPRYSSEYASHHSFHFLLCSLYIFFWGEEAFVGIATLILVVKRIRYTWRVGRGGGGKELFKYFFLGISTLLRNNVNGGCVIARCLQLKSWLYFIDLVFYDKWKADNCRSGRWNIEWNGKIVSEIFLGILFVVIGNKETKSKIKSNDYSAVLRDWLICTQKCLSNRSFNCFNSVLITGHWRSSWFRRSKGMTLLYFVQSSRFWYCSICFVYLMERFRIAFHGKRQNVRFVFILLFALKKLVHKWE